MRTQIVTVTKAIEYQIDVETPDEMTYSEAQQMAIQEIDQRIMISANRDKRFGFIIAFMAPVGMAIAYLFGGGPDSLFNSMQMLIVFTVVFLAFMGGNYFGRVGSRKWLVGVGKRLNKRQ